MKKSIIKPILFSALSVFAVTVIASNEHLVRVVKDSKVLYEVPADDFDYIEVIEKSEYPGSVVYRIDDEETGLPWILKEYTYSAGCANTRTFATCGGFYSNNAYMNYASVTWDFKNAYGLSTTPYQTWFVLQIEQLYKKAEALGAYHYMAAAEVVSALGFMEMLDLYGEIPPYPGLLWGTLRFTPELALPYDDGKTIWKKCLAKIDHAIELFNMQQAASVVPFSSSDIWNNGDINKWIKLCYSLKARWLLRVSKNAEYFAPDEILECLEKAIAHNDDNTFQACYDIKGDKIDFLIADPMKTNANWDAAAYGKYNWVSKYYLDLLTNMRGAGVEDPRTDKLIPSSMTNVIMENGKVKSYEWRRAVGVDIFGDAERLVAGGATSIQVQSFATKDVEMTYNIKDATARDNFVAAQQAINHSVSVDGDNVKVVYPTGAWYVNYDNYLCAGDTAYVNLNAGSQNTNNGAWGMPANDTYYHSNDRAAAEAGAVSGTGSFQIYPQSDFDIVNYAEMCFIKAEVLMRKGDKGGAFTAYKAGIQASFDRMQSKLNQWAGSYQNPSMQPMDAAAIAAYMASDAVCQTSDGLTMSDIMLQKYVAMGWSIENWVDMRRFNYSAGNVGDFGVVYPGYGRTKLFNGGSAFRSDNPNDATYWIRRWRLPNMDLEYNTDHALEMNAHAFEDFVWSIPVWWDCSSDEEYQNYIK